MKEIYNKLVYVSDHKCLGTTRQDVMKSADAFIFTQKRYGYRITNAAKYSAELCFGYLYTMKGT